MRKEDLQLIVSAERRNVPQCNWRNYDAETEDYIAAIMTQPEDFESLTEALWNRIETFKRNDLSMIPPVLLREEGENIKTYVDRIYRVGGYLGGF